VPYFLWDDHQRDMLWGNFGLETKDYAPTLIHNKVMDFIETNKNRPFFCYYALVQPHAEMYAPEEYMKKYRGKFLPESSYEGTDGGPNFRKFAYGSQTESHAAFAAMVNCIDDYVGDVVKKLKEKGIDNDTLIIFTSDNGPHQEGGHDPDYFNSNGSQRGYKRDLYEGGVHVPMIARWPGKVEANSTTDHLSAFWDMMPTVTELAGVENPKNIDGISILPTLLKKADQKKHDYLYWEFHEKLGRVALRQDNWKAVRYHVATDPNSPLELYDLAIDPQESNNIANKFPEIVKKMNALIQQARTESPNPDFNFPTKNSSSRNANAHDK
jgi:arylsulfatase A